MKSILEVDNAKEGRPRKIEKRVMIKLRLVNDC